MFPILLFRNVLGTRNLGDILSEREAIASEMQQGLDSATAPWGVLVERVEVANDQLYHPNLYQLYHRNNEGVSR